MRGSQIACIQYIMMISGMNPFLHHSCFLLYTNKWSKILENLCVGAEAEESFTAPYRLREQTNDICF